MARKPNSSRQTGALLAALLQTAPRWRYGYDLSKETGLKAGTLSPILMRLEGQGWLETAWEDAAIPGRPRRHLYRLTTLGSTAAAAMLATANAPAAGPRASGLLGTARLVAEVTRQRFTAMFSLRLRVATVLAFCAALLSLFVSR